MYLFGNYFTFSEILKMGYSLVITKLFYPKAMLIRRPFIVRGKPRFQYGKGFTTGYNCRIEVFGEKKDKSKKLIIGDNCRLGDNVHIAANEKVVIGDNCLMASKIFISDCSHGNYSGTDNISTPFDHPEERELVSRPVLIGKNVWIGENVCILSGVSIGDGCIIGANSVVTKSVPDYCIVAGAPAKVLKQYNTEKNIWETKR